ncbi:TPA: putative phage tail assembly chaperone [Escherichia coli O174:H8]|nr:putative phage tail assembly chaperone [Escherichia coli O174:H8]
MTTKNTGTIILSVAGVTLSFEPNKTAFNNLINEITMTNKVAPMSAYLNRIVTPASRDALADLIARYPGCEMQIVEKINEVYSPKLEIELKN